MNLAQRLVMTVNQYQMIITRQLRDHNIGASEYPVLIYLVHREGGEEGARGSSQIDIARRQHRDPALITRSARSLEKKGFVTISPDPKNKARNILRLTEKGREVALMVDRMVGEWEERAQADLSEQERAQLESLLSRLNVAG